MYLDMGRCSDAKNHFKTAEKMMNAGFEKTPSIAPKADENLKQIYNSRYKPYYNKKCGK